MTFRSTTSIKLGLSGLFFLSALIGMQTPALSQTVVIPDCPSVHEYPKEGALEESCGPKKDEQEKKGEDQPKQSEKKEKKKKS